MENSITAIITMYNQKELLEICLQWLEQVNGIANIILIDTGSDDGTSEILSKMHYDYILLGKQELGYGEIWNTALNQFPTGDTVVFMNIRYMPGKNCLLNLAKAVQSDKNRIAGPVSNGFDENQYAALNTTYDLLELERTSENKTKITKVIGVHSGMWAISKDALGKYGLFHNQLSEPSNVLMDYELTMIQNDASIVVCKNAIAFDLQHTTPQLNILNHENDREILKSRWGMNYFNRIPNFHLTRLINEAPSAEFHVLEIGCDLGATLLEIKSQYPNCHIHGLEINTAAVNIARHLTDIKEGNIEDECVPFQEKFSYIIFGDVLEHLHNPQKVLHFCKKQLLTEHGYILTSIPNIMHISVMEQLLNGRFTYQDTGLLDKTHIHFFTYYEILLMFQEEGYNITSIDGIKMPLSKEQECLKAKLLELSTNVEPFMYETFQYIIKAQKGN